MRGFGDVLKRWLRDERGATSIEYALIAVFIATAIIASVTAVGTKLNVPFTTVSNAFSR